MTQSGNAQTVIPDAASLREVLARFQDALPHVATGQIVTTILPLIALLVAMHVGAGLRLVAAAGAGRSSGCADGPDLYHSTRLRPRILIPRTPRQRPSRAVMLAATLTPYSQWRRHHAKHHGVWNDLDRRNARGRDIYSSCLTVAEYNALGT
jgi:acyl-lipid omega-6 desaturase (Delta-12 desaturase)